MRIANVAVNLITGFLGAGKTTFIKQLLMQKPADEIWAVLVNEFGEVGLDSALLGKVPGVEIKEVPGGCLCCVAGVPTRVAIAQILRKVKPHRLLIEPTGLGHPANLLATLQGDEYRGVLSLKSTLCLVDPRKLADPRYVEHELFNQQLAVADLVLASKSDCYADDELEALGHYLKASANDAGLAAIGIGKILPQAIWQALSRPALKAVFTPSAAKQGSPVAIRQAVSPGAIVSSDSSSSSGPAPGLGRPLNRASLLAPDASLLFQPQLPELASEPFNAAGFMRKTHSGEGLYACGWCFSPSWCFDFTALLALCEAYPSLRLKAVMITFDGILAVNRLDDELHLAELDDALDSRIEFISADRLPWDDIEAKLLAAGRYLEA